MAPQDRQDLVYALAWVERYYVHIEGDAPTEQQFVARLARIRKDLE